MKIRPLHDRVIVSRLDDVSSGASHQSLDNVHYAIMTEHDVLAIEERNL